MATLDDLIRQAVQSHLSRSKMSEWKLSAFAVGDPSIVPRLMAGGSMRLDKADQLLCYMNQAPIGPGFVTEVEAFLSDTGIEHREFGSMAAGQPTFVTKLRSGASPRLSTVEQVQAWMCTNRSVFERGPVAQEQGDGRKPSPAPSSGTDEHGTPADAPADSPPSDDVRPRGTTVYTKDGPKVILTIREAAALLTLSPRTLTRYREKGGGPRYLEIAGMIRYARADLLEWAHDGQAGGPTHSEAARPPPTASATVSPRDRRRRGRRRMGLNLPRPPRRHRSRSAVRRSSCLPSHL